MDFYIRKNNENYYRYVHTQPMDSNTFERIASVIGHPGEQVLQRDVINAFAPKFKVSQSTVSKWASGERMSVEKAIWFAHQYKVSGWWLLTGEGPMRPDYESDSEDTAIVEILSRLDKTTKEELLRFALFRASQEEYPSS